MDKNSKELIKETTEAPAIILAKSLKWKERLMNK